LAYFASKQLAQQYEWQWRLDDDSLISEDVGYDVFHLMAMNKKVYGYTNIVQDDDKCVIGLWDAAKKYIDENKLDTTFFSRSVSIHPFILIITYYQRERGEEGDHHSSQWIFP